MANPQRRRFLLLILKSSLLGILGGILAVMLFGSMSFELSAVNARIRLLPAWHGSTELNLPPLGTAVAETHRAPVKLQITVEELSLERAKGMLRSGLDREAITKEVRGQARQVATRFALHTLLLSILGGMLLYGVITRSRMIWTWGVAGLSAAGSLAAILGLTALTYSPQALNSPRLNGLLEGMPWAVKIVQEGYLRLNTLDSDLRGASRRMLQVYQRLGSLGGGSAPADEIRLLVISDIHNNVIAINMAAELAEQFDVHAVVNAGDLTDLGTHYEREVALALAKIKRPQLFVSGNHDSPDVVAAARHTPRLVVLNGQLVTLDGIRYLGIADPASQFSGIRKLEATQAQIIEARRKLGALLEANQPAPDVLVAHNPDVVSWAAGKVPLIIYGHTHMATIGERKGTVLVNPGTTGASGIRYFTRGNRRPITAMVLHLAKGKRMKPIAVDILQFSPPTGEFSFKHQRLQPGFQF